MFLRTLYGSRMPQALHPRADPQISSYWQDDTTSSREIARAMDEAEERSDAAEMDDMKKSAVIAISGGEPGGARSGRRVGSLQLSTQLLSQLAPGLDDFDGLRVEDMTHSPIQAQLSPTGLISIAAADIDEAAGNSAQHLPANAELDLEFIEALRQSGRAANANSGSPSEPRAARLNSIFEDAIAQVIAPLPTSASDRTASQSESDQENQSKLRFLSLLRRINELRSQQVDSENWDGLPYPQILALPTFKYSVREKRDDEVEDSHEPQINNTLCAVCYTEYAPEEEVRALPCLHFYHRECIDQWLMHHRICPICKHIVAVY